MCGNRDCLPEEWKDMPEYVQHKKEPYAKIIFRFNNEEDLQEFANLIGQKLTKKTKSAWYPELVRGLNSGKMWVDSNDERYESYPDIRDNI